MNTLNKYLFKQSLIPFLLSVAVITTVLFLQFLIRAVDRFLGKGLDALTIFETEKYPSDQITLIETKLQEEEQAKLAESQKNQQFDAFLQEGDLLLEEQNFSNAKSKYLEAKTLLPDRSIVNQKLQHPKY